MSCMNVYVYFFVLVVMCFYIKLGRSKVTLSNASKVGGNGILAVLAHWYKIVKLNVRWWRLENLIYSFRAHELEHYFGKSGNGKYCFIYKFILYRNEARDKSINLFWS